MFFLKEENDEYSDRLLALELLAKLDQENIFVPSRDWNDTTIQRVVERVESGLDTRAHGIAARNLARVFAWAGKDEEAARLAELTVKWLGEDAESYHVLGRQAQQRGNHAEAMNYFRKALEVYPEYAEAHTLLGSELFWKGEVDEAIRHLREALRASRPQPRQARGRRCRRRRCREKGIAAYEPRSRGLVSLGRSF